MSGAVALSEEEEKREAIPDVGEARINMEALTKGRPESPGGVLGGGALSR